jgi:hypothetical protein
MILNGNCNSHFVVILPGTCYDTSPSKYSALILCHPHNRLSKASLWKVLRRFLIRHSYFIVPLGTKVRFKVMYRNSVDGIVSHFGLNGQGIEPCWEELFPHPSIPALGPPSLINKGYPVSFPGQSGWGVALTTQPRLAPRLKKEYTYISTPPQDLHNLF